MPIFTAIAAGAAAIATAVGFSAATAAVIGGVAAFAARTLLTIGISKLLVDRADTSSPAGSQDVGARVQLPPATDNKLPVVYGSAFIAPIITDAIISEDQKTMWYVCSLCEVTDSGTITFGKVFYDGKLVTFDETDHTKVVSLTTNSIPAQVDDKISGNVFIYFYKNGSFVPTNTTQTAIEILSDSAIASDYRWTSSDVMSTTAFVIVKVIYNSDAGTTNLGQLSIQVENSLNKPGDVIYDYFTNTRYGCAIPTNKVNLASINDLNTYSNQTITYYPVGGGTATQPRYRINGPLNTGINCLSNLQQLVDACDSWLQYSELTGEWMVVINKAYTQSPNPKTIEQLYHIDSYTLIGGIEVNPIDLNGTFNVLEVQYPNANIHDQVDYQVVDLTDSDSPWYDPELLSPNEPLNKLIVQYPQVNNYIQALYLGIRRLLQGREDLVISCSLDYSGIQIQAGDVVRVTLEQYGWVNKLFRVSQVQEQKTPDGFLGARISAFEYNGAIYNDDAFDDFVPSPDGGLSDPNIFDKPSKPVVAISTLTNGNVNSFVVSSSSPLNGNAMYMDFNYGTSSDVTTHKLYRSVQSASGRPYASGTAVSIQGNGIPIGTYYWSVTARTVTTGVTSDPSDAFNWPGPNVTIYDPNTGNGGVGYGSMDPTVDVERIVSGVSYNIKTNSTGDILLPVSVTSSTSNVPVIIPVAATPYVWPAFLGLSLATAGTTGRNYYAASSTDVCTPKDSWGLVVKSGEDNWWAVANDSWSAGAIKSSESGNFNMGLVVASSGTSVIQIVLGVKFGQDYYECDTIYLNTMELNIPYAPYAWTQVNTYTSGMQNCTGAAIFVRNIAGDDVVIVGATLATTASKNPYV